MCCFAQAVQGVEKTRIFARLTGGHSQLLAYQMEYSSEKPNAMILPLPTRADAGENAVRFVNLQKYDSLFSDIRRGFPRKRPWPSMPTTNSRAGSLKVVEVGDFIASFVPSVDDFDRLDPQFAIPKETWLQLPGYSRYGFAVFQLSSLSGKAHPMAFEFQTALAEKIFFPTVHIHDGQVHEKEHFDHELYLQHGHLDSIVGGYVDSDYTDATTKLIRSKHKAETFVKCDQSQGLVKPDLLVHRKILRGKLQNQDYVVGAKGDPLQSAFNWLRLRKYWPAGLASAAAGWFFLRRSAVSASVEREETIAGK